jgi:mannose-1-phosphate guanylyltransferase/mannose-6-phosphate isomerase
VARRRDHREFWIRDGPVVMLDSRSLVHSEESVLTTVLGLDDVIAVSTADAVLVSARAKAEQETGRTAQGAQPSRSRRAPPHLSPVGLLS